MGRGVPASGWRGPGRGANQSPRRHESQAQLLEWTQDRHGQASRRMVGRHDSSSRSRAALLHGEHRRGGSARSREPCLFRRRQARERRRSSGAGRDLLFDSPRSPWRGARGLVFLEGIEHLAPCPRLSAAWVRGAGENALSGPLPAARWRRGRDGLDPTGSRQFHPRQSDRGRTREAHDRRDGLRIRPTRRTSGPRPGRRSAWFSGTDEGHAGSDRGLRG